ANEIKPQGAVSERQSSQQPHLSSYSDHDHEQKLHLIRRLDWRFLLPDPNLNRVIYLGEANSALITAVRYFADYFEILNSGTPGRKPFDLAVVRSHRLEEAGLAFDLLKPGGYFYWETIQKNRLVPIGVKAQVDYLRKIGFENIAAHWHRPNFERALDLVPIFDATALDYFFAPERGERKKSAAGRFLLRTGLLKFAMTCVSIVAIKRQ
ncbi:MAG TPA: hypothetical protein VGA99_02690, partial [bacterium]